MKFWLDIFDTKHGEKAILRWWNINQINFDLDELIDVIVGIRFQS